MSKYQVITRLKVRTATGIREVQAGEVVNLPDHMADPLLEAGRIKPIVPYFDEYGELRIPFGSEARYHWWAGGQGVAETEREVTGWKH